MSTKLRWEDDRLSFLRERVPEYKRAQEEKRVAEYKEKVRDEYFEHYPQPDTTLVEAETKRLYNWYNNHTGDRDETKKTREIKKMTSTQFKSIIKGKAGEKKRQALQLTQAYSALYWESKLKEIVMSEWRIAQTKPGCPSFIKFMNQRVKELFNAEPQSLRDEVLHYYESLKLGKTTAEAEDQEESTCLLPDEGELPEEEKKRRTKARQTQLTMERVEVAVREVARQIREESGLVAHIMLAGPEPARQGRIVTYEFIAGKNLKGQSFPEAYPNYEQNVNRQWEEFAKSCYTKEQRQEFQGVPFPNHEDDKSSLFSRTANSTAITHSQSAGSSKIAQSLVNRKRVAFRRDNEVSSDEEDLVDGYDGYDDDEEEHVVDEEDFDDLFSPNLPPERRVVQEKVSEAGLTLYKTVVGGWVSLIELRRLANIARNKHTMAKMGIPESLEALGIQAPTDHGNGHEPSSDDGLFRVPNIRPSLLPRRVQHPRASKLGVSYTIDDNSLATETSDEVPNPADGVLTTGEGTSSATIVGNDTHSAAADLQEDLVPMAGIDGTFTTPDIPGSDGPHTDRELDPAHVQLPAATSEMVSAPIASDVAHVDSMDIDEVGVNNQENILPTSPQQAGHAIFRATETRMEDLTDSSLSLAQDPNPLHLDTIEFSTLPAWLIKPSEFLVGNFRGESEDALLESFIKLELALHPLNKKLGTKNRPDAVSHWMKHARMLHKVPSVIDLATFPGAVRVWWITIQPEWRGSEWPLTRLIPDTEDWSSMKVGGPNGLFLVIMCLYWWRYLVKERSNEVTCAEFLSVLEDVTFILRAIYRSIPNPNAHPTVSTPTNPSIEDGPINAGARKRIRPFPSVVVATEKRSRRSRQ